MDRVRFGRALGYGARHAARSLAAAVDAATTPNPGTPTKGAGGVPGASTPRPGDAGARQAEATPRQQAVTPRASGVRASEARTTGTPRRVVQAGRQASRSVLTPVKKATSVVMLQVTGSFFALLAFAMGRGLWTLREGFRAAAFSRAWVTVWLLAVLAVGFAYFCVSNFVRAAIRDRH